MSVLSHDDLLCYSIFQVLLKYCPGSKSGKCSTSRWPLIYNVCCLNKLFNRLLIGDMAIWESLVCKACYCIYESTPRNHTVALNVTELSHYNSKHVKSNLINLCKEAARNIRRACSKCNHQFIYVCSELNSILEAMWCSLMKHKELCLMQYPQSLSKRMLRIIINLWLSKWGHSFSSSCLPMEMNVDKVNISCIRSADCLIWIYIFHVPISLMEVWL